MPFVKVSERDRLKVLSGMLDDILRRHQIGEETVLLNVPPAVARHLCFGPHEKTPATMAAKEPIQAGA
jgi:hypothetical protein